MKNILNLLAIVIVTASTISVFGQETETKVVDEVVAQVNDGVITLSKIKREMKAIVDSEVAQGKDRATVQKDIEAKQGELIASMINEELMVQRAKEAGLDKEADLEVNQRIAGLMKQYGWKTVDAMNSEMQKQGVNPQEMRDAWRKQAIRDLVIQREVQSKVYWEPTAKDVKDYFDKNKSKFTKPETVTLSEIFLGFAGRDEKAVREKAKQLVAQLRSGADFAKLAVENSDRPDIAATKGKVDTFDVKQLNEKIGNAVKNLKTGDVTDPLDVDDVGINILRVDDRTSASAESYFDERAVRVAIMNERLPARQKDFMAKLREDSYIKINDTYRPLVAPILFEEERKAKPVNN